MSAAIARDTCTPLWAILCAATGCWLGSAFTREGAERLARGYGYEAAP